MELWIRSKDKEMLTKIDYVFLSTPTGREVLGGNHYMINQHLGTYKTKERALEVLDEIQTFIEKQGTCEATSNEVGIINGIQAFGNVYEMPEE